MLIVEKDPKSLHCSASPTELELVTCPLAVCWNLVLTRQGLGHNSEPYPSKDLVGVVGTGDQGEEIRGRRGGYWTGQLAHSGARWAEVTQRKVAAEVAHLSNLCEKREEHLVIGWFYVQTLQSPSIR